MAEILAMLPTLLKAIPLLGDLLKALTGDDEDGKSIREEVRAILGTSVDDLEAKVKRLKDHA